MWTFGVMIAPAGLEKIFREQCDCFAALGGSPDPEVVVNIGGRAGVTVVARPLAVR